MSQIRNEEGLSRRGLLRVFGAAASAVGITAAVEGVASAGPTQGMRPQPDPMADSAVKAPPLASELSKIRGHDRILTANLRGFGLLGQQIDQWVLAAQQWVNQTYSGIAGFNPVEETGRTGWPTMFALTRALQIELGLSGSQLSDTFGPTTMSLLATKYGEIGPGAPINIVKIVQSGLYCKGYWGDSISGTYGEASGNSVESMRSNMGFNDGRRTVAPKEFKALLTMDAYVLVENGSPAVRWVQQWMNRKYYNQSWFFIIPCDGHSSRDVAKALIYAVQIELAVAGANGTYGPGTRAAVKARAPLTIGTIDHAGESYVLLFQAAMIFNGYEVPFDSTFSQTTSESVKAFQQFVALSITGNGDYQTWSSLLASNGDPERHGTVCDSVTQVTTTRATALVQAGYEVVGRYLTNVPGSSLDKNIKPGELATIFAAGLRVFPIYQTYGGSASYFNESQGAQDASLALVAATGYGFLRGTTIYFAVDFDALNTDITDNVIPHFRGIKKAMDRYGDPYRIGVYGARNVCSRLFSEGLAETSFVSDMSTGFSGNLGFTMPVNWAFDQIATITIGSGTSAIQVDNDMYSGRDPGQLSLTARPADAKLDTYFDPSWRPSMDQQFVAYSDTVTSNKDNLLHNEPQAIDIVVAYDEQITNMSRGYGVRKALLQSEIYWEYWKADVSDPVVDGLVITWYAYQLALEAWQAHPVGDPPRPPVIIKEDCSTGIAQIFAATAIRGWNWAMDQGVIPAGPRLDGTDWHVVKDVWFRLSEDGTYNVSTVPVVLFEGAVEVGISGIRLDYAETELKAIFARYNGFGSEAEQHGREVYGVYQIFESFNSTNR